MLCSHCRCPLEDGSGRCSRCGAPLGNAADSGRTNTVQNSDEPSDAGLCDPNVRLMSRASRLIEAQRVAKVGSWELDIVTMQLHWSRETYRIFEVDPKEFFVTYETFLDLVYPEDRAAVDRAYADSLAMRRPYEITHRVQLPSGATKWVTERCETTFDEAGRALRSVGTVQDVTERVQAEQARRASEERLAMALEAGQLGVWDWNIGTDEGYLSPRYYQLIGYEPGEIRSARQFFEDLIHPEDLALVRQTMQRHLAGQTEYSSVEYRLRHKSGEYRWVHGVGKVVERDSRGAPLRMTGVIRDITERKQAEEALRLNEARLRAIIDSVPECVKLVDRDLRLLEMNSAGLAMIGASSLEEVRGKCVLDLISPEHREVFQAIAEEVFRGAESRMEFEVLGKDGVRRQVVQRAIGLRDPVLPEQVVQMLAISRDVTEERLTERILRTHSEVLLQMSEGVLFTDEHCRILLTNRALDAMFGYEVGELVGQPVSVLNDATPEENARTAASVMAKIKLGQTWSGEFRNRRKNGSIFWTAAQIAPVEISGQRYVVSVQSDITAAKRAEEEIAVLRNQLAHVSRLGTIGELASGLAHELNQPLAALHLYASAALRHLGPGVSPELADCLQQLSQQSLRAGEIVRRMRSFATPTTTRRSSVDLHQLIREVLSLLAAELRSSGVRVDLRLDADLPPVVADGIQLQQVLVNLIRNAMDAMDRTPLGSRVLTIATTLNQQSVRVTVADTGCGVAPETVNRLFDAFYTTKRDGLGLGLPICRTLIDGHGGKIGLERTSPEGSTFYFSIPVESPRGN